MYVYFIIFVLSIPNYIQINLKDKFGLHLNLSIITFQYLLGIPIIKIIARSKLRCPFFK